MRNLSLTTLVILASLAFLTRPAEAQDDQRVVLIQTHKSVMPEDGTAAERDSLLALYQEEVTNKNDLIVSQRHLRHLYGSGSSDWVVITEYRNWNDVEAAADRNGELFRERWTTAEERRDFNRKLFRYFDGHADEIYSEVTPLKK